MESRTTEYEITRQPGGQMTNQESNLSTISVREIIKLYDSLGIPHFQRGLVWGDEHTSLLLESLYFNTPCGTIILWEAEDPEHQGIPLSSPVNELPHYASPHRPQYLIIDGQQRIRSLRKALGCFAESPICGTEAKDAIAGTSDDEADAPSENKPRVWCLNLTRVSELTKFFPSGRSRYSMFCPSADPTDPVQQGPRRIHNLVPLSRFFEQHSPDVSEFLDPRIDKKVMDEIKSKIEEIRLRNRIHSLLDKRLFFQTILHESEQAILDGRAAGLYGYHLEDVVAIYNRINSAGKRVEAEDKAFATLVLLHPSTNQWLSRLFKDVHPEAVRDGVDAAELERDEVLKRRKERNFGFKLFIRTFAQVCAYHFGKRLGNGSFSFEAINNLTSLKPSEAEEKMQFLFDRAGRVVLFVRRLLESLNCDDLQNLPDTTSLLPLFEVLIRFPSLMADNGSPCAWTIPPRELLLKPLQCLALRLLLSERTQIETFGLVKLVDRAQTADEALRSLEEGKLGASAEDLEGAKFSDRLASANSLSDRYVRLLYWLLRENGASDFSYTNLKQDKRARSNKNASPLSPGKEVRIAVKVQPEKQHIVPYSRLAKLYKIEERGRVSRHEANNIGNLTFISHDLNSWETGLGSDPIDLEREDHPENLAHHFLGGEVGKAYNEAERLTRDLEKNSELTPDETEQARLAFKSFYERRRELIKGAFAAWVKELGPLTIAENILPEPPLVNVKPPAGTNGRGTHQGPTREDMEKAADKAGVGDLYRQFCQGVAPYLQPRTNRSSCTFAARLPDKERKTVFGLTPNESSPDSGLCFYLYSIPFAQFIGVDEGRIGELLPSGSQEMSLKGSPYRGWKGHLRNPSDVETIVSLVTKGPGDLLDRTNAVAA